VGGVAGGVAIVSWFDGRCTRTSVTCWVGHLGEVSISIPCSTSSGRCLCREASDSSQLGRSAI
jgi:hypothetical protein